MRSTIVLFASVLFARTASASLPFPDAIRETWGVTDLGVLGRGCRLCHTTEDGNAGTVREPFGVTVKMYGVRGLNDVGSLVTALRQLRAQRADSDRDGIADYDEFAQGTRVNVPDAPESEPAPEPGAGGAPGEGGVAGEGGATDPGAAPPPQPAPSQEAALPMPQTGCSVGALNSGQGRAVLAALVALVFVLRRSGRRGGPAPTARGGPA